jgi:hypothetical protein
MSNETTAQSTSLIDADPDLASLLAVQAYRTPHHRSHRQLRHHRAVVEVASGQTRTTLTGLTVACALWRLAPTGEPWPRTATKRERALVVRYSKLLRVAGHQVLRRKVKPAGQAVWLYTDLYDVTANELTRLREPPREVTSAWRLANSSTTDDRCRVSAHLTVLLPYPPSADALDLIHSVGFTCVYGHSDGSFDRREPPAQ